MSQHMGRKQPRRYSNAPKGARRGQQATPGMRPVGAVAASRLQPRQKPAGAGKVVAIALATLAGVALAVYLMGVIAFSFFFMPNTKLDGQDVSLRLASDVSGAYASKVDTYQAQVTGDGVSFTLKGSDIGLSFDEKTYERGTIGQLDPWKWPLCIISGNDIDAQSGVTYDAGKLSALVEGSLAKHNETATQPTNAGVTFDAGTQQFVVTPEQYGTAVDTGKLTDYLADGIQSLSQHIAFGRESLVAPTVTSQDARLADAATSANRFLSANIPLTLGGTSAGSVTREQISQWVTFDEDLAATLDEAKLAAWVKDNLAAHLDTAGSDRTYTRPDGKQVSVSGGSYGWITDEDSLCAQLTDAIKAGSTSTIDIPTKQTAQAMPDAGRKDWGNRYIDIDITEQHVRMYDDSGALVWESDCVTGDHGKGYDTPTGVYQLNENRASGDVELHGQIDPATGEPEYISHVDYWMPFRGNSWALHDADWRSSFGGTIYQTNGSHGCVNLPVDKARELYALTKVGDVVSVHN